MTLTVHRDRLYSRNNGNGSFDMHETAVGDRRVGTGLPVASLMIRRPQIY